MSKKLYHFAAVLLKDKVEAEDAVQEVCLKLWNMRDRLKEYQNLEAFSMKVIKNWCLDRIKAKKPVYIDQYHAKVEQTDSTNPEKLLEQTDQLEHLTRIIYKLPEQQRMVFQLRDIEGYDFEEISEITELNINTVRVNLSRARNKLRDEIMKNSNIYGKAYIKESSRKIL